MMFTPTDLLKLYIKEAFAREEIPASDLRIQTWDSYRRDLARSRLGVLRTSTGRGFVLNERLSSLRDEVIRQQIDWFDAFQTWQAATFWSELREEAARLAEDTERETAALGKRLSGLLQPATEGREADIFFALNGLSEEINRHGQKLRQEVEDRLRRAFATELRRDNELLDNLLSFLKSLGSRPDVVEATDDADGEDEDDEERAPRGDREAAFEAFKRAVRSQALAAVARRTVSRRSRNGRVLEWLGTRSLPEAQLVPIGRILRVQSALRRLGNPLRHYIDRVPMRYRRFRHNRQSQDEWYASDPFDPNELHPLELDGILLAMLNAANRLLHDQRLVRLTDEPRFSSLRRIRELHRTQIAVDEATDFSPIQLGCMAALSDTAIRSFVACGDFNQRITEYGTRSREDLRRILPDLELRPINITYRHSRQLNELARKLATLSGSETPAAELPAHVNSDVVDPVLAKGVTGDKLIQWLSERIVEIERLTGKLPSIAILVNAESEVRPVADRLTQILSRENIRVAACPEGQVIGQDSDVRVFDVQHIKGLEFEAVFFIDVDGLAARYPNLFDKFLYVGATRAATYLGVTCSAPALPEMLAPLEGAFVTSWG